jgi:large subunit ribosomal protein L9
MAHIDVLLCEDVEKLGNRGQVVRVRAGYGRNYLLPRKLAIEASTGNKRMIDEQRRVLAKRERRERVSAQNEAERLNGLELLFERRVGEQGQLYGSVTSLDIEKELKEKGIIVERRRIGLRDHIKELGDYEVVIKLHREVNPRIKVMVRGEGGQEPAASADAPTLESAPEAVPEGDEPQTQEADES